MFIEFKKTYRISIPQYEKLSTKGYLSSNEEQALLNGAVVIEEKLDGANAGIIRHKKGFSLQKRGSLVGQSEHEQFQFFHAWANNQKYDNIMSIKPGYLVYGELLRVVHHIKYDKLPDWFLVFDILNTKKDHWLTQEEKTEFCFQHGFFQVPLLYSGTILKDDLYSFIKEESAFGPFSEGVVVKRYTKKRYSRGKIVKPEFVKNINNSEHWIKRKLEINKLG